MWNIRYKKYLHESKGKTVTNCWTDIPAASGNESLGYPTQKPLALLERIIQASSNEGDVVLDPFCGCGTAIHAAQKLKRRWLGIDITHLAISIIERRLREAFSDIQYEVHGTPKDLESAHELARRDRHQFQWWACALVGAQPYRGRRKGADNGIDGLIYFQDESESNKAKKIVVSVKSGNNVSPAMIRELNGVVECEKADIGLFVTLTSPTKPMQDAAFEAGDYNSPYFKRQQYSRLQILTIEGLLNDTERAHYPDMSMGAATFKKAVKEDQKAEQVEVFVT